ncbi:CBS domain-containing protein [Candidatus Woesearchaeota archaeon]|nr:CBS domain-containing protein [Candidatus Woesearchaeota archaeon]
MVFDITQLKKIRKQIDFTQTEFAKRANISQSMVAKIESGKLDPTYSYVKKIEETIQVLTKREEKEAKDIMHKGVLSVRKDDVLKKVIELFAKNKISQVPVIENNQIIGMITESSLVDNADKNLANKRVEDIMTESPPIINQKTKLSAIIQILKFYPIVIVQDKGKIEGVITKADIITHL